MHKIDGAGHVANSWVSEDVPTNRPPTEITSDWMNAIQEELVNLATINGEPLVKADNTQVKTELIKRFASKIAVAAGTADALTADFSPDLILTNGQPFYLRSVSANTAVAPTLNVDTTGVKTIIKGNNLPLIAGDILGGGAWLEMQYDLTLDKYVLLNPANGIVAVVIPQAIMPGTIIEFSGSSAPTGYLACPLTLTNVSRTTYAALFAAIGTTWGIGDGATTFGMPYFPADYAAIQANANVGTSSVGQVISHQHTFTASIGNTGVSAAGAFSVGQSVSATNTGLTGGSANLAAGVRVLRCVKY